MALNKFIAGVCAETHAQLRQNNVGYNDDSLIASICRRYPAWNLKPTYQQLSDAVDIDGPRELKDYLIAIAMHPTSIKHPLHKKRVLKDIVNMSLPSLTAQAWWPFVWKRRAVVQAVRMHKVFTAELETLNTRPEVPIEMEISWLSPFVLRCRNEFKQRVLSAGALKIAEIMQTVATLPPPTKCVLVSEIGRMKGVLQVGEVLHAVASFVGKVNDQPAALVCMTDEYTSTAEKCLAILEANLASRGGAVAKYPQNQAQAIKWTALMRKQLGLTELAERLRTILVISNDYFKAQAVSAAEEGKECASLQDIPSFLTRMDKIHYEKLTATAHMLCLHQNDDVVNGQRILGMELRSSLLRTESTGVNIEDMLQVLVRLSMCIDGGLEHD